MHRSIPATAIVMLLLTGCPTPPADSGTADTTTEPTERTTTLSSDVTEVFVGGVDGSTDGGTGDGGTTDSSGDPDLPPVFLSTELFARTFPGTRGATAREFALADLQRTPLPIDFNGDNQPDFAVVNGEETAVVQVFMSQGAVGDFDFLSLSLDRPVFGTIFLPDLTGAGGIATGDIDNDGNTDVVACGDEGVFYLHHPNGTHPTENRPLTTTDLRYWNVTHIDGTSDILISDPPSANDFQPTAAGLLEVQRIVGCVGCDPDLGFTYDVENRFERVALGDIDNDGDLDIVVSQAWVITIAQSSVVFAFEDIQAIWILLNPGSDEVGLGWRFVRIGSDERANRTDTPRLQLGFGAELSDRNTSVGLFLLDLDDDGDLDVINAASGDNNVQVAWFENPGPGNVSSQVWTQWRVGSVREAVSVDVADVTEDGRKDVVIASTNQAQVYLFAQPSTGPKREFDWDGVPIHSSFGGGPIDVRVANVDSDVQLEIITGQSDGRVLYLKPSESGFFSSWVPFTMEQATPAGEVGLLGAADFDSDGDLDLVITVDSEGENDDRVIMLENVPQ